jgi:hypothetical protein
MRVDNGFPEVLHVDLDDIRHLEMRLRLLKDLISCEPMQSQRTDLLRYIPACRIRLSENLPQAWANGR